MSNIKNILTPERILIDSDARSKKRVLEQISHLCATNEEEAELFYHLLVNREKLGSTALGECVALPHCRIPGLKETLGCFIRSENGIDFDAPDDQNVHLIFGLFVPQAATQAHLDLLAQLAGIFAQPNLREQMQQAKTVEEIYNILTMS
jgi:nitrogen PTS system EIIA component